MMRDDNDDDSVHPFDDQQPISQTGLLPVSPSLEPALAAARVPQVEAIVGPRAIWVSALAVPVRGLMANAGAEYVVPTAPIPNGPCHASSEVCQ